MTKQIQNNSLILVLFGFFFFSQNTNCQENLDAIMSANYELEKAIINSEADDFGVFVKGNKVYFSSNRVEKKAIQTVNAETNQYLFGIYATLYTSEGSELVLSNKKIHLVKGDVNTKLNESLPYITKDGNTMYFTGNVVVNGVAKKNLHVLRATKKRKNKWGDIEDLSINDEGSSNGQAVLNADETVMYFVSDRNTTEGNTDIYAVELYKEGTFGIPQKMGAGINTSKKEISPFVTENNELYFASKGHKGNGGFDVFYVDLNTKDAAAVNLGNTINSVVDDFSFSLNPNNSKGFISSNKEGNINIYHVKEIAPVKKIAEKIRIRNLKISKAEKYKNSIYLEGNSITSSLKLDFLIGTANLSGTGKEFLEGIIKYMKANSDAVLDVNSLIEKTQIDEQLFNKRVREVVDYISKSMKYAYKFNVVGNNIPDESKNKKEKIAFYFDYNSFQINGFAKSKLMALVKELKNNSSLKIELSVHADSRGTDGYNMLLAKRRLTRIQNYLHSQNISPNQVTGTAYGETKIINNCINGVTCDESNHKINRRVNYKIIKIKKDVDNSNKRNLKLKN